MGISSENGTAAERGLKSQTKLHKILCIPIIDQFGRQYDK